MVEPTEEVLAVNAAFYAAIEAGDLDGLRAVLVSDAGAVCVHPGADPVHGTSAVLRSWALICANTAYLQFFLTDVVVTLTGDPAELAVVTLTENILSAAPGPGDAFQGGAASAVNVFRRTSDGWRLWVHQAAPLLSEAT